MPHVSSDRPATSGVRRDPRLRPDLSSRAHGPARAHARGTLAVLAAALVLGAWLALAPTVRAQSVEQYALATSHLTNIYVDPVRGKDTARGTSKHPLRTITAAWNRIPAGRPLRTGVRIFLQAGTYRAKDMPNYWENRRGTASAPIIIQSVAGLDTVQLENMNVFRVDHLALVDVRLVSRNDVFHCERCTDLLIRRSVLEGVGDFRKDQGPHETFKANQSSEVHIEESDISGAGDNAIDMVAVQHATVWRSTVHGAQDWCMYAKGGSVDVVVEASTFHTCGTGGITAGQGTGLEFMTAPFLAYEAYDVAIVNNEVHDTEGAAFGVNGGWNVLVAHNTAYRVGTRSHVIEVTYGARSCDGDAKACGLRVAGGAWGPPNPTAAPDGVPIPDHSVDVYDNLVVNPPGVQSQFQQLQLAGARDVAAGFGVPSPVHADDNLSIKGNTVVNGPATMPLGVDDSSGCQPANPTCNAEQLGRDNAFGNIHAVLVDGEHERYGPGPGVWRLQVETFTPPAFDTAGLPPGVPASWTADRSNDVPLDRYDRPRASGKGLPGAAEEEQVTTLAMRHRGGGSLRFADPWHPACILTECTESVELHSWHRLAAIASKGWKFEAWTGDCTARTTVCWVYSDQPRAVVARFAKVRR